MRAPDGLLRGAVHLCERPLQRGAARGVLALGQQPERVFVKRRPVAPQPDGRAVGPALGQFALVRDVQRDLRRAEPRMRQRNAHGLGDGPEFGHQQRLNVVERCERQQQPVARQPKVARAAERVEHASDARASIGGGQDAHAVQPRLRGTGFHQPRILCQPFQHRAAIGAPAPHRFRFPADAARRAKAGLREPQPRTAAGAQIDRQGAHPARQREVVRLAGRAAMWAKQIVPNGDPIHIRSSCKSIEYLQYAP